LWSLPAKDNLEINRLCNGRCQQDSKNAQPDRAPQAVADNCGMIWFATVRLLACAACTLLWFIGSKQPFQRRDCKHQQEDGIAHQPQLVKGPVRDSAWYNGSRQSVKHKTPPGIAPAGDHQQQTSHCQNEGRTEYRSAGTFDMMTPLRISHHKQTGQALILQIAPDKLSKLRWDVLPSCVSPDVCNVP